MDGRTHRRHGWIGATLAIVVLGLLPTGAQAAGNAVSEATFLHFGKPESIADMRVFTTQAGEYISDQDDAFCDPVLHAWAVNTAWYWVTGNGRQLTASATGPVGPIVGVYEGNPLTTSPGMVDCRFAGGTAKVVWQSAPGRRYLIQVGLCRYKPADTVVSCNASPATPSMVVASSSSPPSYDTRAGAVDVDPAAHYDNHGAGRENETNSCGTIGYGNTVWLKWTAPTWGVARFQMGLMTGVVSIRRAGSDAVAACGPGAAEARVAKGETVWIQVGGDVQGTNTFLEGHFTLTPSLRDPDDDNDGTPNAGDCRPLDDSIHPGRPEIRDDGTDQNCFAGDDKARKPTTTGAFSMSGGRLTKFALNEALKGSRIVVTCKGGACRDRKIVVKRRLKRDVKRLKLPRRIVGPLRRGTRIRVEVTNPPEWMGRRFQWRLTSSSTYRYKGFCGVNGRWRSC
jgi:hypothetical protein